MTIRRQTLLILGLATLLPFLAALWLGFSLSRVRLHQRASYSLTAATRQLSVDVDAFVRHAVDGARRAALIPSLVDFLALPASQREELASTVIRTLRGSVVTDPIHVRDCGLLDTRGRVVADINGSLHGRDEQSAAWFREALDTGLPYRSAGFEPEEAPAFWVSAPVRDLSGRILGVLRMSFLPSAFQQLLDHGAATLDLPVTPVLLDADFRLLVSPDPAFAHAPLDISGTSPLVFPRDPSRPGAWARWSAAARQGGSPDRIAVLSLRQSPWRLAGIQAGEVFNAAITDLRQAALLYSILILVVVLIGVSILARRFTRPIQQLAAAAQRVAEGDLSSTVPVHGQGEVTQTAQAFNRMIGRLRELLTTLEGKARDARASEERLRELIDVSPFGIAVVDQSGCFAHLNRKFIELFGYTPAELPNLEDWWRLAFPDPSDRERIKTGWTARDDADGAEPTPCEATVTCHDGTRRVIEFRRRDLGESCIIVCLDLTLRLRAEAELHASEERARLLLEHAPEAVVVMDADSGRFVDVNPAAARLFGFTPAELLEHGPVELSPPRQPDGQDSLDASRIHLSAALGGAHPEFQWQHRNSEGEDIPCEVRLLRLPDAGGRRLIRGSILDISARKQAEDTLRESEERFRQLVENSTELVAQVDPFGILVYVSPNHVAITGYRPETMVGTSIFDYVHPDDLRTVQGGFQSREEKIVAQFRMRFRDGSWHWLESSGRRFRNSSGAEMGVVISRDVTERVDAEERHRVLEAQLRQAQKMEAIGTLAGGIAHDFNNILAGILSNAQLAEMDLPPQHPAQTAMAGVRQAARRARDLVAKILTFSRRSEPNFRVRAVAPVVGEALDLLRASLPATIEIQRDLAEGLPAVHCDSSQLHQVVMNLCANAAQAMDPRGGRITVRLAEGRPDAALRARHPRLEGRPCLRLTVSDTGRGMDAATRERIFEPFFTTKPVGEGTGLGLAMVHGIVEDHQGAITVESTPGIGTTFEVWLPAADTAPAEEGPRTRAPWIPEGRNERILLVDDETILVRTGERILTRLGYRPAVFTQPAAALEEFRRDPSSFSAVLSDLTMPGTTGADFVRELVAIRPGLPVIIATGYMRSAEIEEVRALGVRHFLQKPYSIEALATVLREVLEPGSTPV